MPLKKLVPVPSLVTPPVPLMIPVTNKLKLPLTVSRFVTLLTFPLKVSVPEAAFQAWLVTSVIALLMTCPRALLFVMPPARIFSAPPPSVKPPALLLKASEPMSHPASTFGAT